MSAAYHVGQARMLAHALAEQAAVETLLPVNKANVLATSLRLIKRELDAALAEIEEADRRGRRCPLCGGLAGAHRPQCLDSPLQRQVRNGAR